MTRSEILARLEVSFQEAQMGGFPVNQWPGELVYECEEILTTEIRIIVETGVQHGGWIYAITPFTPKVQHYIGIDPSFANHWLTCKNKLGIHTIDTIEAKSQDALEMVKMRLDNKQIDLLHLDGDHHEEAALRDYDLYSPLVRKGGLVILHDVGTAKGPREALRTILTSERAKRIHEYKVICELWHPNQVNLMGTAILRME